MLADKEQLLGGTFPDTTRAHRALEELDRITDQAGDFDVAFYEKGPDVFVFVQVKNPEIRARAERVLREHGATIETELTRWLTAERNAITHGQPRQEQPADLELRDEAVVFLSYALEAGLIDAKDVLAVLLASGGRADRTAPKHPAAHAADERRQRLRFVDAELRDVTRRLRGALRSEHPDLFDRRGRLRPNVLAARIAAQTGGKETLSGDDLLALGAKASRAAPPSPDAS